MDLTLEYETEAFRRWTEEAIKQLDAEGSREYLRAIALEFLRRVIPKTPVDTGRARAGWHSYLLATGQLSVAGAGGGTNAAAIAEGRAASFYTTDLRGHEQSIVLINAVKYIVILEFGSSGQAPAGMMRITFRELMTGTIQGELVNQLMKTTERANRAVPSSLQGAIDRGAQRRAALARRRR